MNKLEQLREMTVVVADTGDIEAIRKYRPQDCTTNPSLILKAVGLAGYKQYLEDARKSAASGGVEAAMDTLTVKIGTELAHLVPGNVSTEVDARLSYDTPALIEKARTLIGLYEQEGVGKDRILIKLATTWEGVEAARVLQREGIRCNMTLVFSMAQAIASAQAGAYLISPFVGRITDWYKKARGVESFAVEDDPGVQSVKGIYAHFQQYAYDTIVMGASFRSKEQVEALAGCDRLTISPQLLGELEADQGTLTRQLSPNRGSDQAEPLTQAEFRWQVSDDAMATDKLAEGIRQFHQDSEKLRHMLQEVVSA